jgi:hypothetical protein
MTDRAGEHREEQYSARDQLMATLLQKVADDAYPSSTMMDLVEENLQPHHVPVYSEILLDKIRADQYPSIDLIRRLSDLA